MHTIDKGKDENPIFSRSFPQLSECYLESLEKSNDEKFGIKKDWLC